VNHDAVVILALSPHARRELAFALDLFARRCRADGTQPSIEVRQLRDLLARTDSNRQEPTKLANSVEHVDAGPVVLDLDEVADRLGVHRRTVERAAKAGELATFRIGRARRVHPADLDAYIAACRGGHGERPAGVADRNDAPVTRRPDPHTPSGAS